MSNEPKRELDVNLEDGTEDIVADSTANREPNNEPDKEDASKSAGNSDYKAPADAADLSDLIEDRDGNDITDVGTTKVAFGRPRGFFMACPLPEYRKRMGLYVYENPDKPGKTYYGVTKAMRAEIEEAHPCTVVTVVNRLGVPSLWPLKLPDEDGNDYAAWQQQRIICKQAMTKWIRIVKWTGGGYITRDAPEGYAPTPDWKKLPSYNVLLAVALGKNGLIRDRTHPIYRELLGLEPMKVVDDDDDLL